MANYTANEPAAIASPIAEGVRFEIGSAAAYAVRNESRDLAVRVRQEGHFFRDLFGRIPLLRGVARMLWAFGSFFSGMNVAGGLHPQQAVRGGTSIRYFSDLFRTHPQTVSAMLSGLAIPVILFAMVIGLPGLVELMLSPLKNLPRFAVNAVCCAFRVVGALLSVYMICRLRVLNRLCMYRGAAGKVLNAYEAYGVSLTHENAILSSRLTDKSDGAFLLIVLIVSIIAFALIRTESLALQLLYRAGVILAAAAVTNEFILPLERAKPESFGALLRTPLMNLQHLFTIEPHNQMIEVAVCAFRAAYENDHS